MTNFTSENKMKKVYIFRHYPPNPPPLFLWRRNVCLELSYLQPLFEKIVDPLLMEKLTPSASLMNQRLETTGNH